VDLFSHGQSFIRGSNLYKQGAPANFVYIIKNGEFLVTKRRVVIDPQEYTQMNEGDRAVVKKEKSRLIRTYELLIVSEKHFLGEEDVLCSKEY
jgi:CRP-like cAMP-binding protein